jgi:hypothetical protein
LSWLAVKLDSAALPAWPVCLPIEQLLLRLIAVI